MELVMWLLPLFQIEPGKPLDRARGEKADLEKTKLFVYDAAKGITLRVRDEGKVELTVSEEDKDGKKASKSYFAESAEAFEKKYPDLVRRHGLGRYLSTPGGLPQGDLEKWWSDLRKNRRVIPELPDFQFPKDEDWEKWMQDQQKRFEEFRKDFGKRLRDPDPAPPLPAPLPAPGGREFGIKVDSVDETLRDQLSLKEGEGVMVGEVKPGSIAERAAVIKHDIIVKIDGKSVGDKWQFRRDVLEALSKPQFDLEVIRGGKRETVKVKTGAKKDE